MMQLNEILYSDRGSRAFSDIKRLVIARTGHFYYSDKDELLFERVHRRMHAVGVPDLAAYLERLQDPRHAAEEWNAIEATITVGETFFFRYAEQFAALRERVLPAIIKANSEQRRLRVWSAGCSTGAEAYSIAILLDELLGPELADWRVNIIGTDISAKAIAAARAAEFSAWAIRGMLPDDKERYFTSSQPNILTLRPRYRPLARFQQHNLVTLLTAVTPVQFTQFDLILCRNVLIYFHPDTALRVAKALSGCVGENGWLLFGHAEAAFVTGTGLTAIHLPGTTIYRSSGAPPEPNTDFGVSIEPALAPDLSTAPWQPLPVPDAPSLRRPPPAAAREAAAQSSIETGSAVDEIRVRADKGDLDGALNLCRAQLEADPLSARLHFYEGTLLYAIGAHDPAVVTLRRAIYLRKNYPVAQYYLGLSLIGSGATDAGRRAIAASALQARQVADDSVLDDGDGMTAGDLRALAGHYLDASPAVATT